MMLGGLAASIGIMFVGAKRPVTGVLLSLFGILVGVPVWRASYHHTTAVFSHSSTPSPLAHYVKEKLIPVIVGAFIGIGGTILTLYLRHKYWP